MPRYFFDIIDGRPHRDDTGCECANDEVVRRAAMEALPAIAREEIQADGDRRCFVVVARDGAGQAVYTATLSFAVTWLRDRPPEGM